MNILKLYQDYRIPMPLSGHKHEGLQKGWVNTSCPWCTGNFGYHLGFCINPSSRYFNGFYCYRCGGKKTFATLARILNVTEDQARDIARQYGGSSTIWRREKPLIKTREVEAELPPNTKKISEVAGAIRYLLKRGFNPDKLEAEWGIMATGPGAKVHMPSEKYLDYSFRIIIPIYQGGKIVSYQGRDWTGKSGRKYLACLPALEMIPIKHTLYGLDKCEGMGKGRLVEGVTDVWALGIGTVACYGIKYVPEQVKLLASRFKKLDLVFDPEPQAKIQARRIIRELEERGVRTRWRKLPKGKDPAELTEDEKRRVLDG